MHRRGLLEMVRQLGKSLCKYVARNMSAACTLQNLRFGQTFTDHFLLVEHTEGRGWGRPVIRPLSQGITIHPAAPVLHYGMCCFEGMKAYLGVDGRGRLFRSAATNENAYAEV